MTEADQGQNLPRIGIVAIDEVRIAGLRAILTDGLGREVTVLSEPRAVESSILELVLIDAAATEHLLELLGSFRRLRPRIRLLVLGGGDRPEFIEAAVAAGARGVLSYTASEDEVRMAVKVVSEGSVWAPRKILSALLDRALTAAPQTSAAGDVKLTRRELQVLQLLLAGMSNREIAQALTVEQPTVKAHLARLMRKAGVTNRTALGVLAVEAKWL
jgi:DNA-binding NarL/FixJ family response regulator